MFANRRIFLPIACACVLLLTGCNKEATQTARPASTVQVTTVELTPHTIDVARELTGRTTAYRWAEVRPEVGGILRDRCFIEGAKVNEGDLLYRIEPDTYIAALNKAKADLANAKANLTVTALREHRTAGMLKTKSVSQQDYDDAKAALQQAQASVQSYEAALESAEINYRRTEIKAPISGYIGLSNFTAGALLTANQASALTTIYQTDPMYVDVSISSDDLFALKKQLGVHGDIKAVDPTKIKIQLKMVDGSLYNVDGHLNFTGVDVDQTTNTIILRAEFPNPERALLPGLFVRANVILGQDAQAVLAPQKAVLRDLQGRPYVYIYNNGTVERRNITVSHTIDNDWYVTAGLTLGEKIILNGIHNVRSGMQVKEVAQIEDDTEGTSPSIAGGQN